MKGTDDFKTIIKNYLDQRAKEDPLFAVTYAKPKKNIDECCNYIMGEARKRGSAVVIPKEEVFGMAVHYYDEDDIKVGKTVGGNVVAKQATGKPQNGIPDKSDSQQPKNATMKPVSRKPEKKNSKDDVKQLSLFDL